MFEFLVFPFISENGLQETLKYKYSGVDHSWISNNILQPFWRWAVKFVPMWMAPNMVTLIGFVGMIIATYLVLLESATFTEPLSTQVLLICAFLVFVYQTMDALDGKHARNTSNSTPLGQLFDHGCDAVSMCMFLIMGGAVLRVGTENPLYVFFFFLGLVAFFTAQWEEYWTGTMYLGPVGVTEGQVFGIGLYLLAATYGTEIYLLKYTNEEYGFSITLGELIVVGLSSGFWGAIVDNTRRVRIASGDKFYEALFQCFPLVSTLLAFLLWLKFSPNDILSEMPHWFLISAGITFPCMVERMVLCHLTHDPVPYFYIFSLPSFAGVAQAVFIGNPLYDEYIVKTSAVLAVVFYFHFAVSVIHLITNYLGIKAFLVNPPVDMKKIAEQKGIRL